MVQVSETATVEDMLDGNQLYMDQKQAKTMGVRVTIPSLVSINDGPGQLLFCSSKARKSYCFLDCPARSGGFW